MRSLFLLILGFCSTLLAFEMPLQKRVHCGMLTRLVRTAEAVTTVDLREAYLKDEKEPPQTVSEEELRTLPPEAGQVYVLLTFELLEGRTLSRADYCLTYGENSYPCQGIATGENGPFDDRRFKVTGAGKATLLFSCPEILEEVTLSPSAGFPLLKVDHLRLLEKTESLEVETLPQESE